MDVGKLFFTWEGRIGRQDFWLAWLAIFAANIILGWLPVIGWVVWAVALYCSVCIYAKRLHDMGHTGWLQLWKHIPYFVAGAITMFSVIGIVISGVALSELGNPMGFVGLAGSIFVLVAAWIVACLIHLGFLLWVGISEPQPFDNRFGPARMVDPYKDALPIV